MEEDKKEIIEEIPEEQNKEPTKSEENQIQEFYGESNPNGAKKLIIIVIIVLIGLIISLIILKKLPTEEEMHQNNNNQENINNTTTLNDEMMTQTNSDDEEKEDKINTNEKEIYLKPTKYKVTGKKYVNNIEEFIEEKNLNLYTIYIKNGEETPLEADDILSIKNGKMTYTAYEEIYSFTNYSNIVKAAGNFSAQDGATIYFITSENKAYMISQIDNFETLHEFEIENVIDIILTEYSFESSSLDGAIIKTKDNKYYFHRLYEDYLAELIIDESKIQSITQEQKIIKNIKEKKLTEKIEIDNTNEVYDITSDEYHISSNAEKGKATTEISLNKGILKIYTPSNVFVIKNNINKYLVTDPKIESTTNFSIFYVTNTNELYKVHINNDKLVSHVKYEINNVEYVSENYEDKEGNTILVRTKDNDYMLDYKEDIIYKIKY